MPLRQLASLWVGRKLGPVEAACLAAWVALGHRVWLYTYGPVAGVPAGVEVRAADDVLATQGLVYTRRGSPALQADLFRLHLLAKEPGVVWVDCDLFPLRPLDLPDADLLACDADGRTGTALVALSANGAALAGMLAFTGDPHAIPPFVKPALRRDYVAARAAGAPVHVSGQTYGVWGPMLMKHFAKKHGIEPRAIVADAGTRAQDPHPDWGPDAIAVHLGGAGRAKAAPGSWLASILAPAAPLARAAAPVAPRGAAGADGPDTAGIPIGLNTSSVALLGLIGSGGRGMAAQIQARTGCDILIVDLAPDGTFASETSPWVASPWVASTRATLMASGVPDASIRVAHSAKALRPCDLVLCLHSVASKQKARHLGLVLPGLTHADSQVIVDIRKGSGGLGHLKAFGEVQVLSRHAISGAEVARVLLRPGAPGALGAQVAPDDDGWAAIAQGLAGPDGFYRANDRHSFVYIPRGRTLVVTFDNLDIAMGKREDRRPWGFSFIEKQGWSMLGVMANGWTWYRDPWVSDQFDDLAAGGFFAGFDRVVFYGASMGGYAACAFSGAAPGADVVAISPQSTVDKAVVPWESRYKTVWGADFSGKYGDAALVSGAARRITLLYDPFEPLDAAHAARFAGANVMKLRANLLGHRLGSSLQQMGILQPIILAALGGTLTEAEFYRALRARRTFARYHRELFDRLVARGHPGLARQLGQWVLRQGDNRAMRAALAGL